MVTVHLTRGTPLLLFLLLDHASIGAESGLTSMEAYPGTPLGVGRVHFSVEGRDDTSFKRSRINLTGEHSRVLYPVFVVDGAPVGGDGPIGPPRGFEVLFLFKGQEPFPLTASTNLDRRTYHEFRADITPKTDDLPGVSDRRRELLERWWRSTQALHNEARSRDGHYPVVENYLSWHLPRLLGFGDGDPEATAAPPPALSTRPLQGFPELEELADLLIGTESIRLALQRDLLLKGPAAGGTETLSMPLPSTVSIPAVDLPEVPATLEVEAISSLVPEECLYARFPSFSTLRRTKELAETFGGTLHDLILGRALDAEVRDNLQTQLALRETVLGKLFGDFVIGEVALIALDTFVREGSALGFIFEVRNADLFLKNLNKLRTEVTEESKSWSTGEAVESEFAVKEAKIRFLEAPGNRVRSFYTAVGKYHLVTNCHRLVDRFLECAATGGRSSLAENPGFRHARSLHRVSEPENAFIFISDPFVRQLIGPAYRAEMTRRMRARAEMELIEVARLAAHLEISKELGPEGLIEAGYLPASLMKHPDGSTYSTTARGVVDKKRGFRGSFLPIPDMQVEKLTPSEATAYEEFRRFYRRQWGRVDPVAIRVRMASEKTTDGKTSLNRLDLTIDILPYARNPYMFLRAFTGAPSLRTARPVPSEVLGVDVELKFGAYDGRGWYHFGLLDFEPPMVFEDDLLLTDHLLKSAPLYALVPYSKSGDDQLDFAFGSAKSDEDGLFRVSFDWQDRPIWALPHDEDLLLSQDKLAIRRLAQDLVGAEGKPAQARLGIHAVNDKRIQGALVVQNYLRLRCASRSSTQLLSLLHQQLKVPLASCEEACQRILAMKVTCPAGGRFVESAYPVGGEPFFKSDAFLEHLPAVTPTALIRKALGHGNRFVELFRGFDVALTLTQRSLHSELTVRMKAVPAE